MGEIAVRLGLEQFAGEMSRRAGSRRCECQLGCGQGRQKFSHGRIRRLGGYDQRERDDGQQGDRLQILVRIVIEALEPMLVDRHFRGLPNEQRQSVGICDGDTAGADGAAGSGAIFHDHRLPKRRRKLGRDNARHHIAGAAGRIGHDQVDRAARIGLTPSRQRRHGQPGDQRHRAQGARHHWQHR
jgi:hypothetical protein